MASESNAPISMRFFRGKLIVLRWVLVIKKIVGSRKLETNFLVPNLVDRRLYNCNAKTVSQLPRHCHSVVMTSPWRYHGYFGQKVCGLTCYHGNGKTLHSFGVTIENSALSSSENLLKTVKMENQLDETAERVILEVITNNIQQVITVAVPLSNSNEPQPDAEKTRKNKS